ncbi:enediyne biosynthesis protein [Sphaerisporangium sp. TRM90804]|uniref:enediyne biosynthesis protein n=1 Tax=Sphaerisporangium sp. TRM90804 TaxID=3031113 RepID=UPI00244A3234|nr:enediyne biosynthesis protein [Sphaerisporangium sp. TRM90804]MDH2428366.1 enediyne biosynthesis protein [Sphaerisporangium sp. TRM90804]
MTDTKPSAGPRHDPKVITALRNFAMSITVFNILGYTVLGFEQPWLWPFVALATGYTTEIVLEAIGARAEKRAPRYKGGGAKGLMQFLYPAHITSLAMNMLIYVNDQILVLIFGIVVAVGAKWVLRAPVKGRMRHYMNPSNFGIAAILLVFPWASIAPPYHFTEHVDTWIDWLIPGIIILGGTMLNGKLTNRMPLIFGWVSIFALQSIVRGIFFDTSIPGALAMMTGVAFVLFSNYMITDPGTSPSKPASQFLFGGGVALVYGLMTAVHISYAIFFATAIVCAIRGGFFWGLHFVDKARAQREAEALAKVPVEKVPATGKEVASV